MTHYPRFVPHKPHTVRVPIWFFVALCVLSALGSFTLLFVVLS